MSLINTAQVFDNSGTSVSSTSLPATSLTGGNLIVVAFSTFKFFAAAPTGAVTDTAGNTYTEVGTGINSNVGFNSLHVWYCENAVGNAANVITITYSAQSSYNSVVSAQYSDVSLSSALDVFDASKEISDVTSHTSGAFTTSQGNEIVVVFAGTQSSTTDTYTAGSGYVIQETGSTVILEDKTAAGVLTGDTASITGSNARQWLMIVATFKLAAATPLTTTVAETIVITDSQNYFLNKGIQLSDSITITDFQNYSFTQPTAYNATCTILYSFRLTCSPTISHNATCIIHFLETLTAHPTKITSQTCIMLFEFTFFIIAPSNSTPISCVAAPDLPPTEIVGTGSSDSYGYMT